MKHIDFSSHQARMKWLIGILIAILFFALLAARMFHPRFPMRFPNQLQHREVLVPENIQSWMTFEYLNFVFKLPTEYLSDTLSIQDKAYPRMTLKRYASKTGVNLSGLVKDVQKAVRNYKP